MKDKRFHFSSTFLESFLRAAQFCAWKYVKVVNFLSFASQWNEMETAISDVGEERRLKRNLRETIVKW